MSTVQQSAETVLETMAKLVLGSYYNAYKATDIGQLALSKVKILNYKGPNPIQYCADKIHWLNRQCVAQLIQKNLGNVKVSYTNITPSVKYLNTFIPVTFSYATADMPDKLVELYSYYIAILLKARFVKTVQTFGVGDMNGPNVHVSSSNIYNGKFKNLFNSKYAVSNSSNPYFSGMNQKLFSSLSINSQLNNVSSHTEPYARIKNDIIEVTNRYKEFSSLNVSLLRFILSLDYRLCSSRDAFPRVLQDFFNTLVWLPMAQSLLGATGSFYDYPGHVANDAFLGIRGSQNLTNRGLNSSNIVEGLRKSSSAYKSLANSNGFEATLSDMGNNFFQNGQEFMKIFEQIPSKIQSLLNVYGIVNNFEDIEELESFSTYWITDGSLPQELSRLNMLKLDDTTQIANFFGGRPQNFFNAGSFFQRFMEARHSEEIFGTNAFDNEGTINLDLIKNWVAKNLKVTIMHVDPNYITMHKVSDLMLASSTDSTKKAFSAYSLLTGVLGTRPSLVSRSMNKALCNLDHMLYPFNDQVIGLVNGIMKDKFEIFEAYNL